MADFYARLDRGTGLRILCGHPKCGNRATELGSIERGGPPESPHRWRTGARLRPEFKLAKDGSYAVSGHDRQAMLDPHWHRSYSDRDRAQGVLELPSSVRCYVCREPQELNATKLRITESTAY